MLEKISLTLLAAALVVLLPSVSLADHHKGKSKGNAGGQAADHRGERAADQSNAQWQEDAEKGKGKKKDEAEKGKPDADKSKGKDKRDHEDD
jgi:hypothetical protein